MGVVEGGGAGVMAGGCRHRRRWQKWEEGGVGREREGSSRTLAGVPPTSLPHLLTVRLTFLDPPQMCVSYMLSVKAIYTYSPRFIYSHIYYISIRSQCCV